MKFNGFRVGFSIYLYMYNKFFKAYNFIIFKSIYYLKLIKSYLLIDILQCFQIYTYYALK